MLFIDSKLTKRIKDDNGFLIIKDNPIAKAGVFDYLLSEIKSDSDKNNDKIVKVYRPFDELDRIKESFANKPIKFTHLWVGAENKMADGAIGSNIRADEKTGMLYADLIIYNPDLISAIENDKIVELSPAYTGGVVAEIGRYNGEGYEYKQNLGCINHLAVVERGRSGSDLRIADKAFEKSAENSENQEPKETQENQEQEQNAEQGATKILRAVLGDDLANKIMAKFKEFKGNQENENAEKENNQGGDDEVKSENQDKDKKEKAEKIQDERSGKMPKKQANKQMPRTLTAMLQGIQKEKDTRHADYVARGHKAYQTRMANIEKAKAEARHADYVARGKKAAATRKANAEKLKAEARHADYVARGQKAYQTRIANQEKAKAEARHADYVARGKKAAATKKANAEKKAQLSKAVSNIRENIKANISKGAVKEMPKDKESERTELSKSQGEGRVIYRRKNGQFGKKGEGTLEHIKDALNKVLQFIRG